MIVDPLLILVLGLYMIKLALSLNMMISCMLLLMDI
jgi:hypothetical protein